MSWSTSQRPGSTRQARTMRDRVLREEPICRQPGCTQPSTKDDHIIGWAEREQHGLTIAQWHARSNHQGMCATHHTAKTAAEATRGRQRAAAQPAARRPPEKHPGHISSGA